MGDLADFPLENIPEKGFENEGPDPPTDFFLVPWIKLLRTIPSLG